LGGNYVSSLPGGVCADDDATARQLVQAAVRHTCEERARYLWLRDLRRKLAGASLRTQVEYEYVVSGIPTDPDALWKQLRRDVRRQLRKAQRHKLVVAWDNGNLDGFYRIHAITMRDLGSPAVPKSFFERALQVFPDRVRLHTVDLPTQTIGSQFSFVSNGVLYCPYGSSLRRYFSVYPNDLSSWESLRYACANGCGEVNLGRSVLGSGHAAFKRKYLAEPREVFYQTYLNTARTSPAVRGGSVYRFTRPFWRRLPLPVAGAVSALVRRVVPLG
jgi:predicted N-acyltransferase